MRLALVVAMVAVVACQGKAPPPPAPTPAPAPAGKPAAFDACALGTRAVTNVAACAGSADAKSWKMTQQGYSTIAGAVGRSNAQAAQVTCAQMLHAIDGDVQKLGCTLDLTAAERTQLEDLMTQWYAIRTAVVPTGNAAADEVIGRIAKTRDRLCACTDMACLKEVDATLDLIGSFADDAPKTAKDLGNQLVDDMGRCEARLQNTGH